MNNVNHKERKHSRFSASGAERWHACAASVALEEQSPPGADNHWSREGTLAHEVLEALLNRTALPKSFDVSPEMIAHCERAANKIRALKTASEGILLVEKKVFAQFIHREMFGTCDAIIPGGDGTLHIIDFKYGAGHIVKPDENKQLIQYALSVAESYDWDFDFVKCWILQPRAGDNWFKFWQVSMSDLKNVWLPIWQKAVKRVESGKEKPNPGSHCHWCRAKNICPAMQSKRAEKVAALFDKVPLTE
jgi:hypothetical protein